MKKYDIASQLQYSNVAYRTKSGKPKGATIKNGGCGPSSVRNLGNNLLGWKTTIPAVAHISVNCGARYDGGTTISTLLKAMQSKYGGFAYRYTTDDNAAFAAVKSGSMCIIHTAGAVGGTYNKLLSSAGHFMCLAAIDDGYGYIIDSCSYRGKWTSQANRRKYCKLVQSDGLVRVTRAGIKAAIDYYYIVTKSKSSASGKDEVDMTKSEVEKLIDSRVAAKLASLTDIAGTGDNPSDWAKSATDWAKSAGIFAGSNGNFGWQKALTREQAAVILHNMSKTEA